MFRVKNGTDETRSIDRDRLCVRFSDVKKSYNNQERAALEIEGQFTLPADCLVVILGYSGSGKTTFLNLMGGLDSADEALDFVPNRDNKHSGIELHFSDIGKVDLLGGDPTARRALRQKIHQRLGFVFQDGYLLDNFTNKENIHVPLYINGLEIDDTYLSQLSSQIGISDQQLKRRPIKISGGQAQRMAILRAIGHDPEIILADEPTSRVDVDCGQNIMALLRDWLDDRLRRKGAGTIVCVMHNLDQAIEFGDFFVVLNDGRISGTIDKVGTPHGELRDKILGLMRGRDSQPGDNLRMPSPGKPAMSRRWRHNWQFVRSFIIGELFPVLEKDEKGNIAERLLRHRLPHLLNTLVVLSLLFFSLVILNTGWMFKHGLLQGVSDPRLNGIPIQGVGDTQRRLTSALVKELRSLGWAGGELLTQRRAEASGLTIERSAVTGVHGARTRRLFVQINPAHPTPVSDIKTLWLQTRDAEDPILNIYRLFRREPGGNWHLSDRTIKDLLTAEGGACGYVGTNEFIAVSARADEGGGPCKGAFITRNALQELKYTGVPDSIAIQSNSLKERSKIYKLQIMGVADDLPEASDILVLNDWWETRMFTGTDFIGGLPAFDSITVYIEDLIANGLDVVSALENQNLNTGQFGDRLRVTRDIMNLIDYFLIFAIGVVLLLSLISLYMSFTAAIQRKQRQIGVLIAFGIERRLLNLAMVGQVALIWIVALVLAALFSTCFQVLVLEPGVRFVLKLEANNMVQFEGAPLEVSMSVVFAMLFSAAAAVVLAVNRIIKGEPAQIMKPSG